MSDPYLDVVRPASGSKGVFRGLRWMMHMPLDYAYAPTPWQIRIRRFMAWLLETDHDKAA